ncbi:MAG: ABC transporter permease [Ferruginibacter sp.]
MKYNQLRAMLAITKASLRSITRSPSALIFSFIFPFIFIIVFGFIGGNGGKQSYKIVMDPSSDTINDLYTALKNTEGVRILKYKTASEQKEKLDEGKFAGVVSITKNVGSAKPYSVRISSTSSSSDQWPQLKALIERKISEVSDKNYAGRPSYAEFEFNYKRDITEIREYKTIDFILPGQLGFSLLSTGVFGVAFMFFNLRNTLVLKRFFATPISRTFIVLGEGLSRVTFQMITAVVIITVGYFCFGFTLIHGFETFFEMLVLSFMGLVVFMGFGYIISGLAKSDSSIPPFANLITMPQFLLSGTFFSIDAFPHWLQIVAKLLPLTYLNQAMRSVAFEGIHFWNVTTAISLGSMHFQLPVVFILLLWGIVVYAVAIKVFKWE